MLLLGYHPFAEDGGIYTGAIEARLNPTLFRHDHLWVTAHTRFALFVPIVATATRALHLPLSIVLFTLYTAGLVALLAAAAHLARTCTPSDTCTWLPVLVIVVAAGLPVAGTALYAVDPYCTGRTVTTPLLLFALSFALRGRTVPCALCWAAAAAMHPLMAIWGALPLLLAFALTSRRPRQWVAGIALAVFAAALLLSIASSSETPATRMAALTRAYWFPARWRWFEWVGAAAPCFLLLVPTRYRPTDPDSRFTRLGWIAVATTTIAIALALCFARETAQSLAVSRIQPLRSLHLVFLAFLAAAAAVLQRSLGTSRHKFLAIAACAIVAASAFAMQRSLFAHTPHLEWPGTAPANSWETAFAWCSENTPPDALFALNAEYIDEPGEDSHGFRAIALRSALPDNIKDTGIAAVLPALAPAWQTGVQATRDLHRITDQQRRERLLPLGVTWMLLPASASTTLPCPFRNSVALVCTLQIPPHTTERPIRSAPSDPLNR